MTSEVGDVALGWLVIQKFKGEATELYLDGSGLILGFHLYDE